MTKRERCLRAKEYHEKGLNCGQSVLLAFTDVTGFTEAQSMALASGFGGGLRCGGVCGVVNAAAVALGMVCPSTLENGAAGKKRSTELTKDFQRRSGSISWTAAICWQKRNWTPRTWRGSWV